MACPVTQMGVEHIIISRDHPGTAFNLGGIAAYTVEVCSHEQTIMKAFFHPDIQCRRWSITEFLAFN